MDFKALALLAVALILPLLLLLFQPNALPAADRFVIEVRDNAFDPPGLLIQPGDSVAWVLPADTRTGHTVTAYHPLNGQPLRIPLGALPWDSGQLQQAGDRFELRFAVPGVYDYFCRPHAAEGMVGRLIVREASGPALSEQSALPAQVGGRLSPVESILGPEGQVFRFSARLNWVSSLFRQGQVTSATQALEALLQAYRTGSAYRPVFQRVGLEPAVQRQLETLERVLRGAADPTQYEAELQRLKGLIEQAHRQM